MKASANAADKRKFNMAINGKNILVDFDVFQEAGGNDRVLIKQFSVEIAPNEVGTIEIQFSKGSVGEPFINAIEILPN